MKTVYDEAINDIRKLREVAEANARNTIIDSLAPKLKDLIEKNLAEGIENESLDESDFAAASGVAAHPEMSGQTTGEEEASEEGSETAPEGETANESFEVKDESFESLFQLSNLAGPALGDRIVAEVYKTYDLVNEVITGVRTIENQELNSIIRKIEDIYSYLQENDVTNKPKLEEKLETCYGLLNSFRESKMKMKELVSEDKAESVTKLEEEKDVTLRISGLPDDVELENLNIDIISDEEPGEEGEMDNLPPEPGAEGEVPPGPPQVPQMGESSDFGGIDDDDDDDEDEEVLNDESVVEVSIPMLRKAISAVREARKTKGVSKDVLDDFGGGDDVGDPWLDSDMEKLSELQNRRKRDEKGRDQADNHIVPEGSVKRMYNMAAKDLKESKAWYLKHVGTKNEANARKVVERAAKRFQKVKKLADQRLGSFGKVMEESASRNKAVKSELTESRKENEDLRKQLAEVNLLNSKLIHANKLLQREGLTRNQKVTVIDRLDEAASLREVKLIYESLIKAFEGDKGTIKESATRRPKVSGASSRTTASSDRPVISEGMETARWLELAGLSTK